MTKEDNRYLNGQWTGRFTGANTGSFVIELDDIGYFYHGTVYVIEDKPIIQR